jgi:dUTP pyrophosphatase
MVDSTENQVFTHTGHCYLANAELIAMEVHCATPTDEDYKAFAKLFAEKVAGRSIYSFATHLALIAVDGTEGEDPQYSLLSIPVFVLRGQLTPKVVYRGANKLPTPKYATKSSVGFDIQSDEEFDLAPMERRVVKTGLFLDPSEWDKNNFCYLRVAPKSGLAVRHGFDVLAGVVDGDYPSEIGVVLVNFGNKAVRIHVGESVAQGIWECAVQGGNLPVASQERAGGFGSTGQ